MNIQFKYKKGLLLTEEATDFLENKSKAFGNVEITRYSSRSGAIDLVSIIEVSIEFVILSHLQAFAKGFFGEDLSKKLGAKAREQLKQEFYAIKGFIKAYYEFFVKENKSTEEAFIITEKIGEVTLFVVLNHKQMTEALIEKLPYALVETYGKISLGYFVIEANICQLYPDFNIDEWTFLFTPSYAGFGKYVDRYYQLDNNHKYEIDSKEEFINRFELDGEDKYKLIINPLINR